MKNILKDFNALSIGNGYEPNESTDSSPVVHMGADQTASCYPVIF